MPAAFLLLGSTMQISSFTHGAMCAFTTFLAVGCTIGAYTDPASDPDDEVDGATDAKVRTCVGDTEWTCQGTHRTRCVKGVVEREACASSCIASALDEPAVCADAAPAWSCAQSAYQGQQYWTCDAASGELHRCDAAGTGEVVACEAGCSYGPAGTNDVCRSPGTAGVIPMPTIVLNIGGGLVTEAQVRGPIEAGVRKTLELLSQTMPVAPGTILPTITLNMSPLNQGYCSGIASATSANVSCPYGYPVTGTNQNYIVNLSVHELGHVIARQLYNAQAHVDICENEGIATWMAKSYWANYQSQPVSSLRVAARAEIDAGNAAASMTSCVLAHDAPYKVYGSFFEYLETIPGAAQRITSGQVTSAPYLAGWHAWLGR